MIIYHSDKTGFQREVRGGRLDELLLEQFRKVFGYGVGEPEQRAWHQSLTHMGLVLDDPAIPDDSGISIELPIPQTAKRMDFMVAGQDLEEVDRAVIIELKQWESAEATPMDAVVRTFIGGGIRSVSHPSYQAWSYAELLRNFNESVYEEEIRLHPCAFLHNFRDRDALHDPRYAKWLEVAPLFIKGEVERLRSFIKKWVRYGDRSRIIFRIDEGRIRPSKALADSLAALMEGNPEFTMIDDQKVVLERALHLARTTPPEEKRVLIVEGGPGTGKSVVAVNLLVEWTKEQEVTMYVTKNAAPRAVFESKLTGVMTKTKYSNLFKSSGSFTSAEANTFPLLVVDEAHRLNEKSGFYGNLGENQVKELMHAANVTVFFLDEDQRVTFQDIGSREEILRWARELGTEVEEVELTSQFRCNGSDGYLKWLDHLLQGHPAPKRPLGSYRFDYDFRVVDSPGRLRELIEERDGPSEGGARLVAGYCWDWTSRKDPAAYDIVLPEHDFRMRWNLTEHGSQWLIQPDSLSEIGCIHTCQGLELDYVGVIIGPDLVVRDGKVITQPEERSKHDHSIRGYKKMLKADPDRARTTARRIILNTYRTLMTRGLKGCYVWCVDEEMQGYLRNLVGREA
jgi:uncharacterized protein